jgi:hypothetical protein
LYSLDLPRKPRLSEKQSLVQRVALRRTARCAKRLGAPLLSRVQIFDDAIEAFDEISQFRGM